MVQPGPNPDDYPPIDPSEPVPDDPGELLPDTPETLPPAPVEPLPGPDDPGNVPVGACVDPPVAGACNNPPLRRAASARRCDNPSMPVSARMAVGLG